jgi:hypothetical protein
MEHEKVFSETVTAGSRTYFLDLKKTIDDKYYLQITESRKVDDGKFERHNILIFQEDIPKFQFAFDKLFNKYKSL